MNMSHVNVFQGKFICWGNEGNTLDWEEIKEDN